jgi:hypothetical protein
MTTQAVTFQKQILQGLAAFGIRMPDAGKFRGMSMDDLAAGLRDRPAVNTAALVAASSALFYAAERDHNPKVNDIFDASIYCSTCLSVGYGDIFAKTPLGKIIGTTLMTIGPALSGAMLDGKKTDDTQVQQQILTTLQGILQRLPSNTESSVSPGDVPNK